MTQRLLLCLSAIAVLWAFPTVPEAAGEGLGDPICSACHPALLEPFEETVHAGAFRAGAAGPEAPRCERCHGPGDAHVKARGAALPDDASGWRSFSGPDGAARETELCLECHRGGSQTHWSASIHSRDGGRCSNCHQVHRNESPSHLLAKRSEAETCSACHLLPRSQMRKSSHMPARSGSIGEGAMSCSSCHQPHGSPARSLLVGHSVNDNCTSCHAEKRGPFLYEHTPVRESCLNCHDPHGSLNRAMLAVSGPRLCQGCHAATLHPSEARGPNERMVIGRNCMQCHQRIHGSNHPSGFAFTR